MKVLGVIRDSSVISSSYRTKSSTSLRSMNSKKISSGCSNTQQSAINRRARRAVAASRKCEQTQSAVEAGSVIVAYASRRLLRTRLMINLIASLSNGACTLPWRSHHACLSTVQLAICARVSTIAITSNPRCAPPIAR